jgi:hypothetical protein
MTIAANPGCDWLFPGGRSGQPLTPGALTRALGYSPGTAAGHVTAAGGTWNRYPVTRR